MSFKNKLLKKYGNELNLLKGIVNIPQVYLRSLLSKNVVSKPFEKVDIPPDKITFRINAELSDLRYDLMYFNKTLRLINMGLIKDGDWDLKKGKKFEEMDVYRALKKKFSVGEDWKNTEYYERVRKEIEEQGKIVRGCDNIDEYYEKTDKEMEKLYEIIKREGYKTQIELGNLTVNDEIIVCVGRDGEILFFEGRHRLAIARLLELDSVPVLVGIWHEKYIEKITDVSYKKELSPKDLLEERNRLVRS